MSVNSEQIQADPKHFAGLASSFDLAFASTLLPAARLARPQRIGVLPFADVILERRLAPRRSS